MYTTRLIALIGLAVFTQSALANTIWLKSGGGKLCTNTLSSNPDHVIGYGGVDSSGNFTLTISNPSDGTIPVGRECSLNIPKTGLSTAETPIVFSGTVTPQQVDVNFIKTVAYPKYGFTRQECLQQGINYSGISQPTAINDSTNAYSITLGFSYTDGCNKATGNLITPDGQPIFVRTLVLKTLSPAATYNGAYHIFNVNSVPEPGSLPLILAGVVGLGIAGLLRSRKRKQGAC